VKRIELNRSVLLNEDSISFYLLGAIMADGWVFNKPGNRKFGISSKDKDWIEELMPLFGGNRTISIKQGKYYSFVISDLELVNWFIKKGCVPKKSRILKMPNIPDKYLPDFVRGYFDGDGSVSIVPYTVRKKNGKEYNYKRLQAYICSGSEVFVRELNDALIKVGFKPSFRKYEGSKFLPDAITWRVTFMNSQALRFTDWTHYDGHFISMNRKRKVIEEARDILR
jgi:intein-encoded DNA endonuclease-like protein